MALTRVYSVITKDKQIPSSMFMGVPSTEMTYIGHSFNVNGAVTISNEFGDSFTINPADFGFTPTIELYEDVDAGIVAYHFPFQYKGKSYEVWVYFKFNVDPYKVKITITGTLPDKGQIKLPISSSQKRVLIGKCLWHGIFSSETPDFPMTGVGFDWSDVTSGVTFDDANNQIIFDVDAVFKIDPSTVGTSISSYATWYSFQRKSFYANGRFWVFYSDGTDLVWAHSTDGTTWTSPVQTTITNSPSSSTGGWTTPDGAYADGGTYAYIQSAKPSASQTYSGYGFNIPSGAAIRKVRVRYDAWTTGNEQIRVDVSWDGGTTWSTKQVTNLTTTETTYWYDVTSATSWTLDKLSDTNLRVRVDAYTVGGAGQVDLDWIPVEVTYVYPDQTVRVASDGTKFSIWFDGTYLHYAYADASSIYYRRGTPNADGTITWSAPEQTVSTTSNSAQYPMVSVDSNGYVWIGYRDYDGTYYCPYVIKSGNNDGTWGTTPSGFPYQFSTTSAAWRVSIVPLTSGKMLAVYAYDAATVKASRWTGSAWGTEVATTSAIYGGSYHSAVAQGDDVHLTFLKSTGYDILYVKYIYTTNSFGSETTLQAGATLTSAPVLSIDTATNDLYVFAATKTTGTPSGWTANHIYYIKYTASSGTWGTWTDWIDETTEILYAADRLTCFYKDYGSKIGLVYMTKTASPYNIKFAYLSLVVPPVVKKPIMKMDKGPHPRSRLMFNKSLKKFFG